MWEYHWIKFKSNFNFIGIPFQFFWHSIDKFNIIPQFIFRSKKFFIHTTPHVITWCLQNLPPGTTQLIAMKHKSIALSFNQLVSSILKSTAGHGASISFVYDIITRKSLVCALNYCYSIHVNFYLRNKT